MNLGAKVILFSDICKNFAKKERKIFDLRRPAFYFDPLSVFCKSQERRVFCPLSHYREKSCRRVLRISDIFYNFAPAK